MRIENHDLRSTSVTESDCNLIDLHVHSSYSDGTLTPAELVSLALKCGLSAFALTDHDTADGVDEAKEAAAGTGLIVIPGIELSCIHDDTELHILGLGINHKNAAFSRMPEMRRERNILMIQKMRDFGIDISFEKLAGKYGINISITRAHFAAFLTDIGFVKDRDEAFAKYLNPGGDFYIPKEKISPEDTIKLIHDTGGRAILAHPLLYGLSCHNLDKLLSLLKKSGLDGIEAIYSRNTGTDEAFVRSLAKKYDLFITGGSDFHGANKPDLQLGTGTGNLKIPAMLLKNIL